MMSVFAVSASIGQITYDLEIALTSPASGATVPPSESQIIDFDITNNGPDDIPTGDTMFLAVLAFNANYALGAGAPAGSVTILPLASQPISSGMTLNSGDIGGGADFNTIQVTSGTEEVCIFAAYTRAGFSSQSGDPNDASMMNNISCFTVSAALLGFEDMKLSDVLSVVVKDNTIAINSADASSLDYVVVGLNGQAVANGNFNNSVEVSTEGFAPGIYLVSVTDGQQRETKKIYVK